jgi:hypothetical protein
MRLLPEEPDTFRVPKQRTPVEVLLADGTARRCAVFLGTQSEHHDGPERVLDLLEEGGEFFPLHDDSLAGVTLLARDAIAAVRVAPWAEAAELPIEHPVAVYLTCGRAIEGVVSFAAAPNRARVVDHLNEAQRFFVLQEPLTVSLVNKRHVVRVELR